MQGAFSDGMAGLQSRGLDAAICEFVQRGGLLLGICLGAQATSYPCTHTSAPTSAPGLAHTSAPGPGRQHARTTGGAQVRPQSACAAQGPPGFPFERGSAGRGYY